MTFDTARVRKRGRPPRLNRDEALDAATDLIREGGFTATSMEEILSAMKISRSSFYQAFGSKEALLLAVLERYSRRGLADLRNMAASNAQDPLRTIVFELAKFDDPRGCLIVNCMVELSGRNADIAALLRDHNAQVIAILTPLLGGDEARANAILATCYGATTMRKVGMPLATIRTILERIIA
ncbi:TetR/AcrR family transcriptional regulator [Fulvimarina sp. 2208YS6-2-32]|uniref:TetR/AcrR family transcriptional regulator n=1 Tax=Fulvimarina uroteuthidis TaxID=3098149 RepID=A0ABU5I430_9HYPH|nr:TetR/AcrR family transcriptional regulator [Fulvimarina sp. 2208YS6-2-32]MDY8110147.1 TetR/AcrR family transcriptional regulator [Fulvimarina sp. 2208YS6-2-32]